MAQNVNDHESFQKKINQWEKMKRHDWQWEHAPTHRQKVLKIVQTKETLRTKVNSDMSILNGLEEGLEVMKSYLTEKKRSENEQKISSPSSSLSLAEKERKDERKMIQDCLALKHQTKEKVQKDIKERRHSEAMNFLAHRQSHPGDMTGAGETKPAILEEDRSDLPQPTPRYEPGLTFLTDVAIEETPPPDDSHKPMHIPPVLPPAAGHKAVKPMSAAIPTRTRNIQSVESLLKLFPEKEGESVVIRRKSLEPTSRRRISAHSAAAAAAIEGTTLVERQTEWMEKLEAKRRSAKMAQDKELVKELRPSPNISVAQESWEKAKKSHAREVVKESAHEILKRQLEEMKEEMKNLRMEEKTLKMKCSRSAAKILENEKRLQDAPPEETHQRHQTPSRGKRCKGKRKKRRERGREEEGSSNDEQRSGDSHLSSQQQQQQHVAQIVATPVRRNELSSTSTRPASAGPTRGRGSDPRRPPSSSSSRSSLHTISSSSLFPELEGVASSTSLIDVLDLVLSPSPRYPFATSGGSKSANRREAFQMAAAPSSHPSQWSRETERERERKEDDSSHDSSDIFSLKSPPGYAFPGAAAAGYHSLQQQQQQEAHRSRSPQENDSQDDSTMISNITDRTGWKSSVTVSSSDHLATPPSSLISHRASTRFFDSSSTSDKGRYRLNDARDFDIKTMFRKVDVLTPSVTLLMGTRRNGDGREEIITVLFDRSSFTEQEAKEWWEQNRERLIVSY